LFRLRGDCRSVQDPVVRVAENLGGVVELTHEGGLMRGILLVIEATTKWPHNINNKNDNNYTSSVRRVSVATQEGFTMQCRVLLMY
jgi:hypothetical protein